MREVFRIKLYRLVSSSVFHPFSLSSFSILQEEQLKLAAIIRAEGDAAAAALLAREFSEAGDGLVELRKIEAAEDIAYQLSQSPNVVYLPSGQNTLISLPQ
jgi:prohibitin 1